MTLVFADPILLWLGLAALLFVAAGLIVLRGLDALRRSAILLVRVALVLLLAAIVAEPLLRRSRDDVAVVAAIDASGSVRRFGVAPADAPAVSTPPSRDRARATDAPGALETSRTAANSATISAATSAAESATHSATDADPVGEPRGAERSGPLAGDATGARPAADPATPSTDGRAIDSIGAWLRGAVAERRPDDRFGLILFDREVHAIAAPGRHARVPESLTEQVLASDGSDLEAAIRFALALLPSDASGRILLASDGAATRGDARAAAEIAAARGVPIDVLPIATRRAADVRLVRLDVPASGHGGQTVDLRLVIEAPAPTQARLHLRHQGRPIGGAEGAAIVVDLPAGNSVHLLPVTLESAPVNRFEALVEPLDSSLNAVATNDRAEAATTTPARGRALVLSDRDAPPIASLLRAGDRPVTTMHPSDLPEDLLALQEYDLVVLDDVPASALDPAVQAQLARHVHDLGAGLLMLGGENGFGAGGWKGTPIEPLLPVACDPPLEIIAPPAALVLVIDRSGSMNAPVAGARASQQEVANRAAIAAIESLRRESLVGVVAFNTGARTVVPLRRNDDPEAIARAVGAIRADGGTDVAAGLRAARRMLAGVEAERRRVVCLTDGRSPERALEAAAAALAEDGIALTTIAIGDEADHALLRRLAEAGGGAFYPVYNPRALPRVLVDSVRVVNRPLIREGRFRAEAQPGGSTLAARFVDAPPLDGMVITGRRDDPRVTVEAAHPEGEPLLAHWPVGIGRAAAFTSDVGGAWSESWSAWSTASAIWSELAALVARPGGVRGLELVLEREGDGLRVALDAVDEAGAPLDFLDASVLLQAPDGTTTTAALAQVAPGRYAMPIPDAEPGTWVVAALATRAGRALPPVVGAITRTADDEWSRREDDHDLLRAVAEATGGRVLAIDDADAAALFSTAGLEPTRAERDVLGPLVVAAILLFLIDVALRRISWSRTTLAAAAARRSELDAMATARSRRAAEAASALRAARTAEEARVAAEAPGPEVDAPPHATAPATPPTAAPDSPDAEAPARASATEIAAAIAALRGRGGAETPPDEPRREAPDAGAPAESSENLLDSMRRARARARRRIEGDDEA